jgi:hypothetical protein
MSGQIDEVKEHSGKGVGVVVVAVVFCFVFLRSYEQFKPYSPNKNTSGESSPLRPEEQSVKNRNTDTNLGAYADFSTADLQANNIRVSPGTAFSYNQIFGGSWSITALGGGFTAIVVLPENSQYELVVTHLTSMEPTCPGRGYSPITIQFDSESVVANYDPSTNHAARHDMVTDRWSVVGHSGQNTIRWIAGALCTHYWIRRIEFRLSPNRSAQLPVRRSDRNDWHPVSGCSILPRARLASSGRCSPYHEKVTHIACDVRLPMNLAVATLFDVLPSS